MKTRIDKKAEETIKEWKNQAEELSKQLDDKSFERKLEAWKLVIEGLRRVVVPIIIGLITLFGTIYNQGLINLIEKIAKLFLK